MGGGGLVQVAAGEHRELSTKPPSLDPLLQWIGDVIDSGLSPFEEDPVLLGVLSLAFLRGHGIITQAEVSEWGSPILTRMRLVLDEVPDHLYPISAVVVTGSRDWPKSRLKDSFVLSNIICLKEMRQILGYVPEGQEVHAGHEWKPSSTCFDAFYVQMPQPDLRWQKRSHVILLLGETGSAGDEQSDQRGLIRGTIEGVFVRDAKGWRTLSLSWYGAQRNAKDKAMGSSFYTPTDGVK